MRTKRWLVGVMALVVLAAAGAARAQEHETLGGETDGPVIATVAFEFSVGERVLPAGRYEIEVPEAGMVTFRPVEGKTVVTAPVITRLAQSGHAPEDEARVVFDKVGERYVAAEVWFPDTDGYLIAGSKPTHTHRAVKLTKTT